MEGSFGVEQSLNNMNIVTMPLSEALRKVSDGEIVDAKTILAIQWLALQNAAPAR